MGKIELFFIGLLILTIFYGFFNPNPAIGFIPIMLLALYGWVKFKFNFKTKINKAQYGF